LDVLEVVDEINRNLNGGRGGEGESADDSDLWIPASALATRGTDSRDTQTVSDAKSKSVSRASDLAIASYFSSSLSGNVLDDSDDLLSWTAHSVSNNQSSDDRLDVTLSQELDDILGL